MNDLLLHPHLLGEELTMTINTGVSRVQVPWEALHIIHVVVHV
jgi:hypothetical protein